MRYTRTMMLDWKLEDHELLSAQAPLGHYGLLHLAVESLAGTGWDWHVWDNARRVAPRYGVAETMAGAKQRAELAATDLNVEFLVTGQPCIWPIEGGVPAPLEWPGIGAVAAISSAVSDRPMLPATPH